MSTFVCFDESVIHIAASVYTKVVLGAISSDGLVRKVAVCVGWRGFNSKRKLIKQIVRSDYFNKEYALVTENYDALAKRQFKDASHDFAGGHREGTFGYGEHFLVDYQARNTGMTATLNNIVVSVSSCNPHEAQMFSVFVIESLKCVIRKHT